MPHHGDRAVCGFLGSSGQGAWLPTVSLIAVVFSTAVLAPGTLFRFSFAKLLLVVIAVVAAAWAVPHGRMDRRLAALVGAGGFLLLVAALRGDAAAAQLLGRWPRYEGLLALSVYVGAGWAGTRVLGPQVDHTRYRMWWNAISWCALLHAAVSLLEAAGLRPLGGDVARPGALLGNASDQGIIGMMFLLLLAVPAVLHPCRLWWAGLASAAATLTLAASRGALLGAVIGLLLMSVVAACWKVPRERRPGRSIGSAAPRVRALCRANPLIVAPWGVLIVIGVVGLAVPLTRARVLGESSLADGTVAGRADLWRSTLGLLRDSPWLGAGPSGFVDALPLYRSTQWGLRDDPMSTVDSPHAMPLQVAASGGIMLVVVCLAIAVLLGYWGVRRVRRSAGPSLTPYSQRAGSLGASAMRSAFLLSAGISLVAYAVALLTHFTSAGTTPLAAFLLGAVASRVVAGTSARREPHPAGRRAPWDGLALQRWVVLAGGTMLGMILIAAMIGDGHLRAAVGSASRGDVTAADLAIESARRWRPWDADVPLVAATIYAAGTQAGDKPSAAAAERWSIQALGRTPRSVEAMRILGMAHTVQGDFGGAITTLDRAAVLSPEDRAISLWSGMARAQLGQKAQAEALLSRAAQNPFTAPLAQGYLVRLAGQ